MAKYYATNTSPRNPSNQPIGQADGSSQGGHVRVYREQINLATVTNGATGGILQANDTVVVALPTRGEQFLFGVLTTTVSFGATATIAIGTSGAPTRYKTAGTFQTVDTPTLFGAGAAGLGALGKLAADDEIVLTLAAANAPASGTLTVDLYFAQS